MLPVIAALASAAGSFFGGPESGGAPISSGGSFAPGGMMIGPKVVGRGSASAVQTAANTAGPAPVPLPQTVPNAVAGTSSASLRPVLSDNLKYALMAGIAGIAILAVVLWPSKK